MLSENRLRTKATNMTLNPLNLPISRVGSICDPWDPQSTQAMCNSLEWKSKVTSPQSIPTATGICK